MTFLGKTISDDWLDISDIIELIELNINRDDYIDNGHFMTYVMEDKLSDAACVADHWNRKRFHKIAWFCGLYVDARVRAKYFHNS